jgi:hypothetical protein
MKKLTLIMMAAQAAFLAFPLAAHADGGVTASADPALHAAVHVTLHPPVPLPLRLPDPRTIAGSVAGQVTRQVRELPIPAPVGRLGG